MRTTLDAFMQLSVAKDGLRIHKAGQDFLLRWLGASVHTSYSFVQVF